MSDATNAAGVPGDDADDAVLAELRGLADALDPVPKAAIDSARSAIAWRTMEAELAELTRDMASDLQPAGIRGADAPVLLTFEATTLIVEIEVVDTGSDRRILGQLVPPGPGSVDVRHRGGTVSVPADEVGRFVAGGLAAGPVSLRCVAGDRVVETDWFLA